MAAVIYGPGDAQTWGPCTGHPNDPRTDDDGDWLTEDQALEQAEDEELTSAETVADWLAKAVAGDFEPWCHKRICTLTTMELYDAQSVGLLLSIIMTGSHAQVTAAACRLRELARKAMSSDIKARAAELMREAA